MERGHPTGFVLTSSQLEPRRDGVANQRGGLKRMYCKQRVRRVVVCQNLYLRLVLLLANCQLNRGDTRGLPKEAAMVPLSLGIALLEQAGVMRMMPFSFGRIKCVIFFSMEHDHRVCDGMYPKKQNDAIVCRKLGHFSGHFLLLFCGISCAIPAR